MKNKQFESEKEYRETIDKLCNDLKKAGAKHCVDLSKHICRLIRQWEYFDRNCVEKD